MQLGPESVDDFHSPVKQIHSEMLYNCKSLYVPQLSRERLSRACKMVLLGQRDLEENWGQRTREGRPYPSSSFCQDTDRAEPLQVWRELIQVLRSRDNLLGLFLLVPAFPEMLLHSLWGDRLPLPSSLQCWLCCYPPCRQVRKVNWT